MINRSANATIKGYFYQFDHTIVRLLSAATPQSSVVVEGIEDIGESVVMPSLVKVAACDPAPSSHDIPYFQLWKEEWKDLDFDAIKKTWLNQ